MDTVPANPAPQERTPSRESERSVRSFRRTFIRGVAVAVAVSLLSAFALSACGDDDDANTSSGSESTTVKATQIDGKITLDKTSSQSGNVEFDIENTGTLTHEFVVLKTDLPEGDLPLVANSSAVDESAAGLETIGERENIAAGADAELSFDNLESGKYVLICNVPGHYGLGMHTTFTVS